MNEPGESSALVKKIEAKAYALGFCLFGVTTADPPADFPVYEKWLANGLNAGMSYMASDYHRSHRKDPQLLLPGASSILVLGWPYPLTVQKGKDGRGWVAGYATEPDYHERLMIPLHSLLAFIESSVGKPFESRLCTDSAPVLERELAHRAGLGWIARNSCLIAPKVGSNFLLAEIFLTLELPPSNSVVEDRCGTCHRCIDACPTRCIRWDRTIDAARCISYLTIENKNGMPQELREPVGDWLFGCDICQTVCPWNSKRDQLEHEPVQGSNLGVQEMTKALALSSTEFKRRYAGSPILRARRNGFERNLITVLGNTREISSERALKDLLITETDEILRELATWALAKIAG